MNLPELKSYKIKDAEKHLIHFGLCSHFTDNLGNPEASWNLHKFTEKDLQLFLMNGADKMGVQVVKKKSKNRVGNIEVADIKATFKLDKNKNVLFLIENKKS